MGQAGTDRIAAETTGVVRASPARGVLRILRLTGRTLFNVTFLLGSLITFPSCIPWMIAIWLVWHTVELCRGRSGWRPLLGCVVLLLLKRGDWPPALVTLMLVMLVAAGTLAIVAGRQKAAPTARVRALCGLTVWGAWLLAAVQWHAAAHHSGPPLLLSSRPVVCLGDSLTSFLSPEGGYPRELQQRLAIPVLNWGQAGSMTQDALRKLPQLREVKPLAVVIELGGNDFLAGRSRAEIKANLETIIATAEEVGATVVLFEVPRGLVIDPFGGLERGIARERDLELIPDTPIRNLVLWSRVSPLGKWIGPALSDDGLHPNELGDRHMAEWAAGALLRLYGQKILAEASSQSVVFAWRGQPWASYLAPLCLWLPPQAASRFLPDDHTFPASGNAAPGRLIGRLERHVDIPVGRQEKGHVGKDIARRDGFKISRGTGIRAVSRETQRLFRGHARRGAPKRGVQAVRVVAARWVQVDHQEMPALL